MANSLRAAIAGLLIAVPSATSAQPAKEDSGAVAPWFWRPEVSRFLEYFTGPARDRMSRWLTRGTRYQDLIQARLERLGLPDDFAYLPLIESGFSETAVSKAGAVGMWQFIPETARQYGLRVDRWVDERRDPYRATDAAIRHLRDLSRTFGDSAPLLAAAAYNAGSGRIGRSLTRLRGGPGETGGSDQDFFSLAGRGWLARETRDYVPQLLAAAAIGRDPARYGFAVDTLPDPAVDSVKVLRPIQLAAAERVLGLDRSTLTELNPQLIRGMVPPGGSWLRVPQGFGDSLVRRLGSIPAVAAARFESRARLGALIRVTRGETLGDLARRHRVSEASLRRVNALPRWYRLRPGQVLRLPAPS
jgi:membrane-bound lytic murein transglycosylase D